MLNCMDESGYFLSFMLSLRCREKMCREENVRTDSKSIMHHPVS